MHDLERNKPYGRAVDRVIRYGCMNLEILLWVRGRAVYTIGAWGILS